MISIVIPCYNVADFIGQTLDSLLCQPYSINKDFEIICIDDCSSDETRAQLLKYEKKGVILTFLPSNKGVSHARNVGLQKAQGEYVWFFDADDIANSNAMNAIFGILNGNRTIDAVRFYASYVAEESSTDNIIALNIKPVDNNLYCFVFKHSFLKSRHLSFCETMTYGEDVSFLSLCFINEMETIRIDEVLYFYRQRSSSLMHKRNQHKYFNSINQLPYYYLEYYDNHKAVFAESQNRNIINLIQDATHACLIHSVKQSKEVLLAVVNDLRKHSLYPYPMRWNLLKSSPGIKVAIAKAFYLFAPNFRYLIFLNNIFNKFNAKRICKKQ